MNSTVLSRTALLGLLMCLGQLQAATPAISFNAPKGFEAFTYTPQVVGITAVAGDFNGDGKQDVAAMNSGAVTILLGNGDGTFQAPLGSYPTGYYPIGMAAADFNGDGKLDLAIVGTINNVGGFTYGVQILLGNGDGTFQLLSTVAGNYAGPLVIGDFNREGKLDLAVGGSWVPVAGFQVLLGNGDGTFQTPVNYTLPGYPNGMTEADFNGDGILDLGVVDSGYLSILLGNGDGTFQPAVSTSEAVSGCISAADFNGDGKADLALCGSNSILIELGNGDGAFAPPVSYAVQGDSSVTVADLNNDGRLDLAVDNTGTSLSILFGRGDGTFAPQVSYPTVGGGGWLSGMTLADFNGDGYQDVAVGNASTVTILMNNRRGAFPQPVQYGALNSPAAVAVGDFNHDGKQDLAVADTDSHAVSILLGNGNGTFQSAVSYLVGMKPSSIVVADFNRDGNQDLAVANSGNSTISVLLGVGDGTFQPAVTYSVNGAQAVALGDFNGDGKVDLATANFYPESPCHVRPNSCPGSVSILLGNGDGTFQAPVTASAGNGTGGATSLTVADFNGDGKADVALALPDSGLPSFIFYIAVLLGNGDGTFQPAVYYDVGDFPSFITAADLNGDGHPDLAVANNGYGGSDPICTAPCVTVLIGNGDGTFKPAVAYFTGGASALAFGDFNRDGKVDMAVSVGDAVSILVGNGDGTFQLGTDFLVGSGDNGLAIGDFNRDGRQDLAIAVSGNNAVTLLTNTTRR